MTNKEKLNILITAKKKCRSEVHRDLREMDKIQRRIERTEVCIESLERSIKLLEERAGEKLQKNRNQPNTETAV